MSTQTEERATTTSGEGGGAFRVVLVAITTLVVAGSVLSLVATGFAFRHFFLASSNPPFMVTFGSGIMDSLLILLPFVALAAIAYRGIERFPWLGWFLPLYICLLALGTAIRSLPLRRPLGPDMIFGVLLLILALVLLLVRPRPAPSTEPTV